MKGIMHSNMPFYYAGDGGRLPHGDEGETRNITYNAHLPMDTNSWLYKSFKSNN